MLVPQDVVKRVGVWSDNVSVECVTYWSDIIS